MIPMSCDSYRIEFIVWGYMRVSNYSDSKLLGHEVSRTPACVDGKNVFETVGGVQGRIAGGLKVPRQFLDNELDILSITVHWRCCGWKVQSSFS